MRNFANVFRLVSLGVACLLLAALSGCHSIYGPGVPTPAAAMPDDLPPDFEMTPFAAGCGEDLDAREWPVPGCWPLDHLASVGSSLACLWHGIADLHGHGQGAVTDADDGGIVPPHSRFHPVPTRPVFAPRPGYAEAIAEFAAEPAPLGAPAEGHESGELPSEPSSPFPENPLRTTPTSPDLLEQPVPSKPIEPIEPKTEEEPASDDTPFALKAPNQPARDLSTSHGETPIDTATRGPTPTRATADRRESLRR